MKETESSIGYVPEPFMLNCLKHHAGYISDFITCYKGDPTGLEKQLLVLGKSQMDLYTGGLSPAQVTGEIKNLLGEELTASERAYLGWLGEASGRYRELSLSDGSVWILLPGKEKGRYIHVHPGRWSPDTIRVRSETLKSAIAVLIYCRIHGGDCSDLAVINEARVKLLGLSPVKEAGPRRGLGRMISILKGMMPEQ
ncbi:MAG: hypothetical protein EA408_02045 [Marinilabiliales bacterium]|nr:MAG: hypothetical protein EA408_02045 [Marinilabiliales bacterium]